MTPAANGLSADELAELRDLLVERLAAEAAGSDQLDESLDVLLSSRSESTADDEHDPEGPTLSSEWSRLHALRTDAAQDIRAITAALERLRLGTYGVCARCGRPIGVDRLRARPTAVLCIQCARETER